RTGCTPCGLPWMRGETSRRVRRGAWGASASVGLARLVDGGAGARAQVATQPVGETGFGQAAFGQRHHLHVFLFFACIELGVVEREEHAIADVRGALVAVHEGVVAGKAVRQARCERGKIGGRVAAGMQLLRARQRRIEQALVAHARAAAVLGQLALMDGDGQGARDPDDHGGAYCASLRRRSRSLRMTSSATSICAASSGSNAVSRTPSGVSSAYSVSPFSSRSRASSSLGRMTPAELPMVVIL